MRPAQARRSAGRTVCRDESKSKQASIDAQKGASLAPVVLAWMWSGEKARISAAAKAASVPAKRRARRYSKTIERRPQASEKSFGDHCLEGHAASAAARS